MTRARVLALITAALVVAVIVRTRPWSGIDHRGEVGADPRRPPALRAGEGILLLALETRVHGTWTAEMWCLDVGTGAAVADPRRVRSSIEPTLVQLPAGTYRVVIDGMPRAGERGGMNEVCGRCESVVTVRGGEVTRLQVREPGGARLILMVVDAERALARPRAEGDASRPDGVYLEASRPDAAHEVVFFRPDAGSKASGTWRSWSLEFPDEVSGPVPPGDFTLATVARGRTLGRVPVKLVNGEITRVVLRVE